VKKLLCITGVAALSILFSSCSFIRDPGVYRDFFVSEDLALKIGEAVLRDVLGDEAFTDNYILSISDFPAFEGKKYFVVVLAYTYTLPNGGQGIIPGDAYGVAINKKDGKILKIWIIRPC